MCIFCGGSCGGAGEFLISMGLPLLALYFFRIKGVFLRVWDKILGRPPRGGDVPGPAGTGAGVGQPRCAGSRQLSPWRPESPVDQLEGLELAAAPGQAPAKPMGKSLTGVKGWLFLLCLNLLLFIPAFSLYQVICSLALLTSPQARILLLIWSKSSYYFSLANLAVMLSIAFYSFYSGLKLWNLREGAVKIAKTFLLVQFGLTLAMLALQRLILPPAGGGGFSPQQLLAALLPALLFFGVWYTYLTKSRRVQETYAGLTAQKWPNVQESDLLECVRAESR
jgi:hypothetical protein